MTIDQRNVLAAVEKMTAALLAGDIDGVMTSYENEATVVFEPGQPISDPEAIKKMFLGLISLRPDFTYSGHEVFVVGDIAVHFAPWKMQGKTPEGQAVEQSGLSVAVLRRQADGGWLMIFDNPNGESLMAGQ